MRLPYTEPFEWRTAMPVDLVAKELHHRVVSTWSIFRSRLDFPVSGRVRERSAVLAVRPLAWFHNSFNRVLAVDFEPLPDGGTVLRGVFRFRRDVTIFMALWFAGVLLAVVTVTAGALFGRHDPEMKLALLIVWGMLLFGIGLVWFGGFLSRLNEHKMIAFLQQTVGSHEGRQAAFPPRPSSVRRL